MALSDIKKDFLGRGWSFPPTFEVNPEQHTGTVCMVQGEDDIRQGLDVLFSTMQKERVMLPGYGCGLHQFVFDSVDSSLFAKIKGTLSNAIMLYEPRINLVDISVMQVNALEARLQITLTYTVRQTNARSNMVYDFYLRGEGTNVRSID